MMPNLVLIGSLAKIVQALHNSIPGAYVSVAASFHHHHPTFLFYQFFHPTKEIIFIIIHKFVQCKRPNVQCNRICSKLKDTKLIIFKIEILCRKLLNGWNVEGTVDFT